MGDLAELYHLTAHADDPGFRSRFLEVKRQNKTRLARLVRERLSLTIDIDSLFDAQVKRIHKYKRQLLNVLHLVTRDNRIRAGLAESAVPRTVIISCKAAPEYVLAKLVIQLIHDVAELVNHDPAVGGLSKVVFIPEDNVSNAEWIVPACDLPEQISLGGPEASGTGNMKLARNSALTIGTRDGASVEMLRDVGDDNMFIFGMTAEQVAARRATGYNPSEIHAADAELRQAPTWSSAGTAFGVTIAMQAPVRAAHGRGRLFRVARRRCGVRPVSDTRRCAFPGSPGVGPSGHPERGGQGRILERSHRRGLRADGVGHR